MITGFTAPLQKINDPILADYGVNLYIKREDMIHPFVSGNKWRKLKYNLLEAKNNDTNTILSFGGAFSNHIYSLAAAGKLFHFNTIGVIRGELTLPINPTLEYATHCGMKLQYVSRENYRLKEDPDFIEKLKNLHGDFYFLPEGGSNALGVKGCAEIVDEIDIAFDYICCACGSGGTLAGIVSGLKGQKKALGFSALKGEAILNEKVESLIEGSDKYTGNWSVNYDYHFGGYAKINKELLEFMDNFKTKNNIQLEPVYTAKMMYGIYDLIKRGRFKREETIVAIHTGGLQGLDGMREKMQDIKC